MTHFDGQYTIDQLAFAYQPRKHAPVNPERLNANTVESQLT
jgi:hypothetical protein